MKIAVGTKNAVKIEAVRETLKDYPQFSGAEIVSHEAPSGVSEQPKSLKETLDGAMNRARAAFKDCSYSFGIESGLMQVPYTKTGYMDVTACAIFDGKKFHLGLSSCFEYPVKVTERVLTKQTHISEAFHALGLTENKSLGSSEGAIGILTKGRIKRKDYTRQAITMALIHLENPELY